MAFARAEEPSYALAPTFNTPFREVRREISAMFVLRARAFVTGMDGRAQWRLIASISNLVLQGSCWRGLTDRRWAWLDSEMLKGSI